MRAFISHITEESAIATCLKKWIESTLLGNCDVFVSSDSAALPAGVKWLQEIDTALSAANVLFVICSSRSLPRPWVNFETGYAWARGIPVVPLCHSGISKSTLPRPIADFQAIDLVDERFPQLFLESLQTHFKLAQMPRVELSAMRVDIATAVDKTPAQNLAPVPSLSEEPSLELHDESIKMLHYLGQQSVKLTVRQLAAHFLKSEQQTKFFLEQLSSAKLIRTALNMRTGTSYELNENGRAFLFDRGML